MAAMNDIFEIETTSGPAMVFDIFTKMSLEEKIETFAELEQCIRSNTIVIFHTADHDIWNSFASKVKEISEAHGVECYRADYSNRSGFRVDYPF